MKNWDQTADSSSVGMHLAHEAILPTEDPDKYKYSYLKIKERLEKAVRKYLTPSPATAKGHLDQNQKNQNSTKSNLFTVPVHDLNNVNK